MVYNLLDFTGASKGTPGDAKCVTEIIGGNKEVRGDKAYLFVKPVN